MTKAEEIAQKNGDEFVSIEPLLMALLAEKNTAADILKNNGVSMSELEKAVNELRKGEKVTSQSAEESYQALSKYAVNLNDAAKSGKLDPVIGRDDEIRRILQILSRRTKNNPILIGEPGTGKTAIVEGLAHRIVRGDGMESPCFSSNFDINTEGISILNLGYFHFLFISSQTVKSIVVGGSLSS